MPDDERLKTIWELQPDYRAHRERQESEGRRRKEWGEAIKAADARLKGTSDGKA